MSRQAAPWRPSKTWAVQRLAVLLAGVLALGLMPPGLMPTADAAGPSRLVLRGSRSASADITLRATTTMQVGGFDPRKAMRAVLRGSYAGFVLQRLDRRASVVVGGVVARGFDLDGSAVPLVFGEGIESVRVPAGRYRITLLTDGLAEVSLPAPGLGRTVVITPTRRASVRGTLLTSRPLAAPLLAVVPTSHLRVPVAVGSGTSTVLASVQSYTAGAASAYDVCLAPTGAQCATGAVGGGSGTVITPGGGTSTSITALYFYPGDVAPATYDAVFTTAGAGVAQRLAAFALRIG